MSEAGPARILVVTAHPDDADFGVAGSVATWTDAGIDVTYCVVTDGDAGGFDPGVTRDEMRGIRQGEQRAAAEVVGVTDVVFLGYPDGRVQSTIELRRDITRVMRRARPDRVVTQSPERNWARMYASHPDHLAVGDAAVSAVYPDARNPFAHPELAAEGLGAWTVPELWIMPGPTTDVYVDITDAFDRKVKALLCHESQHLEPDTLGTRLRERGAEIARAGGLADGRIAEGFFRVATG